MAAGGRALIGDLLAAWVSMGTNAFNPPPRMGVGVSDYIAALTVCMTTACSYIPIAWWFFIAILHEGDKVLKEGGLCRFSYVVPLRSSCVEEDFA